MTLDFQPLIPWSFIAVLTVVAILLSALGFWRGVRGATFRTAALAALILAACQSGVLSGGARTAFHHRRRRR